MSTKDGRWTQILFDFNTQSVTAAIHFNERYYVGTAADGLRVVQPDRHGGYEWYPLHAGADSFASDRVTALAHVDGALWVGTADAGISIWDPQTNRWATMNSTNSQLPSNTVHHIRTTNPFNGPFVGGIWVATSGGVLQWKAGKVTQLFTKQKGLPSNDVWDVDASMNPLGPEFYFATDVGMVRYEGGPKKVIPGEGDCTFDRATQLVVARDRTIWLAVATKTEVGTGWEPQGLCRLSVGFFMNQWQAYRVATGNLPSNTITALKIDDVGRVWASLIATNDNERGGVAFYDGQAWQLVTPPQTGMIQAPIGMLQRADKELLLSHVDTDGLTIFIPAR
ncbi:MAG: hypothetical protein R2932_00080 [Caldilineaceae bacterium]